MIKNRFLDLGLDLDLDLDSGLYMNMEIYYYKNIC